jgi:deoxyribonuclease-4
VRANLACMLIGAHVDPETPLAAARERDADVVQFFLADPQSWKRPVPREDADELKASDIAIYVHSPYVINVASANNRVRVPSRKIIDQHAEAAAAIGALGLVVHGGHVGKDDDPAGGFDNWRKTFERASYPLPILIENTAGGDNACARRLDDIARLWDAVGDLGAGFCLDTCHAFAAGEELLDIVDRVKAITGRIDLVHLNDSKDVFESGRDRHTNVGTGTIDPELLLAVVRAADAPVICETPGGIKGQSADIAFLRGSLGR